MNWKNLPVKPCLKDCNLELKKAMIPLKGMEEHWFRDVYYYQCYTLLLYLYKWILFFPLNTFPPFLLSPFYIMVEKGSLHRNGMAAIPKKEHWQL